MESKSEDLYLSIFDKPKGSEYKVLYRRASLDTSIYSPGRMYIRRYKSDFSLNDSIGFLKGISFLTNDVIREGNYLFIPATFCDTIINNCSVKSELAVLKLDTNLNFIAKYKISSKNTNEIGLYAASNLLMFPGFNILVKSALTTSSPYNVVYKLSKQFQKLDSLTFSPSRILHVTGSINEINLFGNAVNFPCNKPFQYGFTKLTLDSNLNITNCFRLDSLGSIQVPNQIIAPQNINIDVQFNEITKISNTKYLVAGNCNLLHDVQLSPPFNSTYRMARVTAILDNSNHVISCAVQSSSIESMGYVDYKKKAHVKGQKILTVGVDGYAFSSLSLNQTQPTKIFVCKMDTNGTVDWMKWHGGNMFYYPESISFTDDGGCLVAGWRFDSTTNQTKSNVQNFLLKLDKDGNFNSLDISLASGKKLDEIGVFPNPTNDKLNFEFFDNKDYELTIYNCIGEPCYSNTLNYVKNDISVSSWQAGLYLFELNNGTTKYVGKFLKTQ